MNHADYFIHNTLIEIFCVDRDDDPLIFDEKHEEDMMYTIKKIGAVLEGRYILVTGITNILSQDKRIVAYFGYGFSYQKLFSRFAWHYEHLELGFNIYPEGLLVIHPFLGWHWDL